MIPEPKFKPGDMVKFTDRTPMAGAHYEQHDGHPAGVMDVDEDGMTSGKRYIYNIMWVDGVEGSAFEHELERLDVQEQPPCPTVV